MSNLDVTHVMQITYGLPGVAALITALFVDEPLGALLAGGLLLYLVLMIQFTRYIENRNDDR